MLLVDFEFMLSDEEGSEDNINMEELNRTFDNPTKGAFVPASISEQMKSATDEKVEEPVQRRMKKMKNWMRIGL